MKRPLWQRVLFGEVSWKDMTTAMKVANVFGGFFALMIFMEIPLIFVVAGGALFAYRYRKLQKAEQS